MSADDFLRTIVITIFVINAVYAPVECIDSLCVDPACTLKPGDYCLDNKTCEVLYCSTMSYSWAQISRYKCLGMNAFHYENFYRECRKENCSV